MENNQIMSQKEIKNSQVMPYIGGCYYGFE